MNVLLLNGSPANNSSTRAILDVLGAELQAQSVSIEVIDLKDLKLPELDPEHHAAPEKHHSSVVREFVAKVDGANALALATPVYHGSFSGLLKSAIDHLRWDAFRGKPVGILTHGGGIRRCAQPVEHLRTVVSTLFGYAAQTAISTAPSDYERDGAAVRLASGEIRERIKRLADELIMMAEGLSKALARK